MLEIQSGAIVSRLPGGIAVCEKLAARLTISIPPVSALMLTF